MEPNVLIVEDDATTAGLVAALASYNGFAPDVAADGDAALRRISAAQWDVIVLDLLLPRTNGFELLRHLKCTHPDLLEKTIVVTAASDITTRDCSELKSVWRFMHKPVDVDALTTEMMACVAEHSASLGREM